MASFLYQTAALFVLLALAVAANDDGAAPTAGAVADVTSMDADQRRSVFHGESYERGYPKCRAHFKKAEIAKTRKYLQPCGFANVTCQCANPPYRQFNGECNNPINTALGSVDTPYNRVLRARYADGVFKMVTRTPSGRLPKARVISTSLYEDKDLKDPIHTLLLMQWGQLVTHDGGYREDLTNGNGVELDCCAGNATGGGVQRGRRDRRSPRRRRSSSGSSDDSRSDHSDSSHHDDSSEEEEKENLEVTSADGLCIAFQVNSGSPHSKYDKQCVSFVRSEYTLCDGANTTHWSNWSRHWDFAKFWRHGGERPNANAAQQLNTVTSFLDLSIVYGNSDEDNQALREGTGGLLRSRKVIAKEEWFTKEKEKEDHSGSSSSSSEEGENSKHHSSSASSDEGYHHRDSSASSEEEQEHPGKGRHLSYQPREFLPLTPEEIEGCDPDHHVCYKSGDDRVNSHPWLASLQTILMREHNRLAKKLAKLHPQWNDETLFQEARRILIAEWQVITYKEYLPKIVGKKILKRLDLLISDRTNYSSSVNPTTLNEFSHAAFRFLHSMIDGTVPVLGEARCPFLKLRLSQQVNDPTVLEFGSNFEGVVRGLTHEAAHRSDRFVTKEMTDFGRDQVATDILRGRDHGVPSYNAMRDICGLRRAKDFDDFKDVMTEKSIRLLKRLYHSVHDVDLYVGGTLEEKCVDGDDSALVGPTLGCVIAEQFYRWRRGDRYFFDLTTSPAPFTQDQYHALTEVTLAGLLCDNLDGEKYMQPDPFLRVSKKNELKLCQDIPSLDLRPWKTYELPEQCSATGVGMEVLGT